MSFTVVSLIYVVLCIIGLHIGVNYLYSVHTTRKVEGKDVLFALACIVFNVLLLALLVNKDKKAKNKAKQEKENYITDVARYNQALSNYIPYFDKKRHTVASLIHSGNPYAYILGQHLRDVVKKETSYTLQDIDIYNNAQVVLNASQVDVVNAKYDLEKLNKREI
jgi:hypothetical protein